MSRRGKAPWVSGLVAACGLGLAVIAVDPGGAWAQPREAPSVWDMWEAPGPTRPEVWEPDRMDRSMRWRMTRHSAFLRDGVPEAYRGAYNPLSSTPATVRQGGALYATNCARCHDPAGMGHGEAGLALYPSPALLADLIRMPRAVDEYLLWTISEGGEPFATAMPAFKDKLSREQIWQIVTFMRAGFPASAQTGQKSGQK
jgi:mono/diheme cytochrome c family protein